MDVTTAGFWILVLGAGLVGFSKTAINGTVTVAVALFAMVLPTRESTGTLLLLLLVGDALAVWTYRRDAEWPLIRRLLVPVVLGVLVGVFFLVVAPAGWLKPVIGVIVVVMSLIQAVRQWQGSRAPAQVEEPAASAGADAAVERAEAGAAGATGAVSSTSPARAAEQAEKQVTTSSGTAMFFGSLAGFTTMVANAGGPVMTLYLLRSKLEVKRFVGTLAWFFACVNLVKLPFSIGLGLVRPERLELVLLLIPAVVLGAVLGRLLIGHIPRRVFENLVLLVAMVSGVWLVVS